MEKFPSPSLPIPEKASRSVSKKPAEEPASRSQKRSSGLAPMLGAAALLHIGGLAGAKAAEGYISDHQQRMEEARRQEIIEQRQHARESAIQEARRESERGDMNLWRFLVETNNLDTEEVGRPIVDTQAAERELSTALNRFRERYHGPTVIHTEREVHQMVDALRYAFEGHHYYAGMKSLNPLSFLRDRGGPCGATSFATLSLLDQAGFEGQLGIHFYLSGEHGESAHAAPTITFQDSEGRAHEVDLTSGGGEAFPSGVRVSIEELVEGYAAFHHLPTVSTYRQRLSQSVSFRGGNEAWGVTLPTPRDKRPFPSGAVPFYASDAFSAYHTDAIGNVLGTNNQVLSTALESSQREHTEQRNEINQSTELNQALDLLKYNYAQQTTTDSSDLRSNEQDFSVVDALSETEWNQLSHSIAWAEQRVQRDEIEIPRLRSQGINVGITHLANLGIVIGLYQLAEHHSTLQRRVDPASYAAEKIEYYHHEATAWLATHQVDVGPDSDLRSSVLADEAEAIVPLTMIGREGTDLLFRLYDQTLVLQNADELNPEQVHERDVLLAYLILSDSTREGALQRANALPLHEQFILIEPLRSIRVGQNSRGAILEGMDVFSKNYRAQSELFHSLASRCFYDIARLKRGLERSPQLRELSQLIEGIHTYAVSHQLDQQWENEVLQYGINRVRMQILNTADLFGIDRDVALDRFHSFFESSATWLDSHQEHGGATLARTIRRDMLQQRQTTRH